MYRYPALLDLEKQTIHPLGPSESFLVGRNETADICVLDPTCSRHHFRIVRRDDQYQVEPLNARNPTYYNGRRAWRLETLEHGSTLQAGQARFRFLLRPPDGVMAVDAAAGPMPVADDSTVPRDKGALLEDQH
jgi:pSer/pThr/pTyr-binding forkhead associated (FHA) protein